MKSKLIVIWVAVLCLAFVLPGGANELLNRKAHASVGGGIGLPKIPFSQYRTPVSFLVNGSLPVKIIPSFWLQATGGALTTIHLGTVNSSNKDMRFNVMWAGAEGMYRFRHNFRNEGFIAVGIGQYHLSQLFDDKEDVLDTLGFSLALVNWTNKHKWDTTFELRWHILFEPDNNPQMATITFGFLL